MRKLPLICVLMTKYILTFLTFFIIFPLSVYAAQLRNIEDKSEIIEENIEDDLYVGAQENVIIKGDVKGDLFVGGGDVEVQGKVGGDVYIGAGNINIENSVGGNVFVGGGQVRIRGTVERNLNAFGGDINIEGEVKRDLLSLGGNIDLNGIVGDDARILGGNLTVNGEIKDDLVFSVGSASLNGNIGGDVYGTGGELRVTSDQIGGDLQFWGDANQITLSDDLEVQGQTNIHETMRQQGPDFDYSSAAGVLLILKVVWNIVQIIGFIIVGYLLVKFAPIKTDMLIDNLRGFTNQLKSFGVGCISFFLGIILVIFLTISLFGIPLAKLLVSLAFVTFAIITPLAGLALGRFICKWFGQKYNHLLTLLLGITLLQVFKSVPVAGNIIEFYIFFIVIGVVIRWLYQKQQIAKTEEFTTIPGIPHYYGTEDPLDEISESEDQLEIPENTKKKK